MSIETGFLGACSYCGRFSGMGHAPTCVREQFEACIDRKIPITKTEPWGHQKRAYWFADQNLTTGGGAMLALSMGLGKSKVAIDLLVNRKWQRTLVVCPLSVVGVWPRQVETHAGLPVNVLVPSKGLVQAKAKEIRTWLEKQEGQQCMVVLNYDVVWRPEMAATLLASKFCAVIADEIHRIKNPTAKSSIFMNRLGMTVRNRLGLSGTPMSHSPLDLFAEYRFLDPKIFGRIFVAFRSRYCIMGGYEGREVTGYQNMGELESKFKKIAYVAGKEELDLPPFTHQTIPVSLSAKAQRIYVELENDFCADVKSGVVTAANALVRLLRLQQVTSGTVTTEDGMIEVVDSGKEDALTDLLEDLDQTEKVVVFGRFTQDLKAVSNAAAANKRCYFELSGSVKQSDEWTASQPGSVLGVNIQSGGLGVDLTAARYCVYYSVGFSLGDFEQSLARVHRPGQSRSVTYYHLIASGTVDVRVRQALEERRSVIEEILKKAKGEQ